MTISAAPLFEDVTTPVAGGEAFWLTAADGVCIRAAVWSEGPRGTVLMLPGRTEYIEKYVHVAGEMRLRGFATVIVDWRGQGLADRPLPDRQTGHVERFTDYQHDLAAVVDLARALSLPLPLYLLAHSMGGCIALRTLMDRSAPIAAAVFTGPMWGIKLPNWQRPAAWALGRVGRTAGQGHRYAPGTGPVTYVAEAPFEDNVLTSDRDMFAMMQMQVRTRPELSLGGPSLHWLYEALVETRLLARRVSPQVPALAAIGSRERVVDPAPVAARMERWPGGRLSVYDGAEHEIVVEAPAHRARLFDEAAALFAASPG